jgi:hypothetical protein
MKQFDLDDMIGQWKSDYGTLVSSRKWNAKYFQIPVNQRFELLTVLIKQIKDAGKEIEYFASNLNKDKIIEACIPHQKSVTPQAYGMFKKGTLDHLNMAIREVYCKKSDEELAKMKSEVGTESVNTSDPTEAKYDWANAPIFKPEPTEEEDVIDPEMADLLGYNDE